MAMRMGLGGGGASGGSGGRRVVVAEIALPNLALTASKLSFEPSIAEDADIATINAALGAGSTLTVLGALPDQLKLTGFGIRRGTGAVVTGEGYSVMLREVSADGHTETASTFVFVASGWIMAGGLWNDAGLWDDAGLWPAD